MEEQKRDKIEFVILRQPDIKLVGIDFNYEAPPSFRNEYDYARFKKHKASNMLLFQALVEKGYCDPEDTPHMFVTNLNFDVNNAVRLNWMECKETGDPVVQN